MLEQHPLSCLDGIDIFCGALDAQLHPELGTTSMSLNLVIIGAVVALLAVLVGGLPIAVAVVRCALVQKRRGSRLLLATPILAFAIFLGTMFLLKAIDHPGDHLEPVWQLFLYRDLFFGTLIAATIVSAGALCFAVARSEIPEKLLRFALLPSILATISMVLILAATFIWVLACEIARRNSLWAMMGLWDRVPLARGSASSS